MVSNMKKGVLILFLVILLPYLVNIFFYHEKGTNNLVKVKIDNKVINVPLEEYIIGVVAAEMPVSFDIEALKAQAVASRSYVAKKKFTVTNDTSNQVYLNKSTLKKKWGSEYKQNINKIKKAVYDTKGEVLVYKNEVIEALFFSTSSGYTENSEEVFSESRPYLKSVASTWDSISPSYQEIHFIKKEEFCDKLSIDCNNLEIKIVDVTSTGRSKKIEINNKIYDSSEFIKKLNLKSSYLTISVLNDNVVIETKGYGHGVGMSQYGALAMALNGSKYDEILKYYYQNSEIKKI